MFSKRGQGKALPLQALGCSLRHVLKPYRFTVRQVCHHVLEHLPRRRHHSVARISPQGLYLRQVISSGVPGSYEQ